MFAHLEVLLDIVGHMSGEGKKYTVHCDRRQHGITTDLHNQAPYITNLKNKNNKVFFKTVSAH